MQLFEPQNVSSLTSALDIQQKNSVDKDLKHLIWLQENSAQGDGILCQKEILFQFWKNQRDHKKFTPNFKGPAVSAEIAILKDSEVYTPQGFGKVTQIQGQNYHVKLYSENKEAQFPLSSLVTRIPIEVLIFEKTGKFILSFEMLVSHTNKDIIQKISYSLERICDAEIFFNGKTFKKGTLAANNMIPNSKCIAILQEERAKSSSMVHFFERNDLTLYIFDIKAQKGIRKDIPKPDNAPANYLSSIMVNNSIYLIGSYNSNDDALRTTYLVDLKGNKYIRKKDMICSRKGPTLVDQMGKFIYAISGYGCLPDQTNKDYLRHCEKYSIRDNEWKEIASIPSARQNTGSCVFNKIYIYSFAGYGGSRVNNVNKYDSIKNTWDQINFNQNNSSWGTRDCLHAIQIAKDQILVYGGDGNGNHESLIFTPSNNTFTDHSHLEEGTCVYYTFQNPIMYKDKIYVVGDSKYLIIYSMKDAKFSHMDFSEWSTKT